MASAMNAQFVKALLKSAAFKELMETNVVLGGNLLEHIPNLSGSEAIFKKMAKNPERLDRAVKTTMEDGLQNYSARTLSDAIISAFRKRKHVDQGEEGEDHGDDQGSSSGTQGSPEGTKGIRRCYLQYGHCVKAPILKVEATADDWKVVQDAMEFQVFTKTVQDAAKKVRTEMKPLEIPKKHQKLLDESERWTRMAETNKMELQELRAAVKAKIQQIGEAQAQAQIKKEEYKSMLPDYETEQRMWQGVQVAEAHLDELLQQHAFVKPDDVEQEMARLVSEVETKIYNPLASTVHEKWQGGLDKIALLADGGAESNFAVAFTMKDKGLVLNKVPATKGNNAIVRSDLAAITDKSEEEVIASISAQGRRSNKGKAANMSPSAVTPSNGGSPATAVWSGSRKTFSPTPPGSDESSSDTSDNSLESDSDDE